MSIEWMINHLIASSKNGDQEGIKHHREQLEAAIKRKDDEISSTKKQFYEFKNRVENLAKFTILK